MFSRFFFFLAISFMLISCEKDDGISPGAASSSNSNTTIFQAFFDNDKIARDQVVVNVLDSTLTDSSIQILAYSNMDTLVMSISNFKKGYYSGQDCQFLYTKSGQKFYSDPSFEVFITEYNQAEQVISGEFSGMISSLDSSIDVSNGSFKQLELNLPKSGSTNDTTGTDTSGTGGSANFVNKLTVYIDGVYTEFDSCSFSIIDDILNGSPYQRTFIYAEQKTIYDSLPNDSVNPLRIMIGEIVSGNTTYSFGSGSGNYADTGWGLTQPKSGSITITTLDTANNKMTGTFSFISDIPGAPPQFNQDFHYTQGNFTAVQVD